MNTDLAKALFQGCHHDPDAKRIYDIMRGGFLWDDELPRSGTNDFVSGLLLLAPVIAYRASLTLSEPHAEYASEWDDLRTAVPSWPGFRQERILGPVERELRAAKLKEDRCLAELEKELGDHW